MDGSTLTTFDLSDPMDISQIVAHGAGFQGTEMSDIKGRDWAIKEAAAFYRTRKSILLNQFAYATFNRDREGIADARKAIRNYNDSVPHGSLSISGPDMKRSLKVKRKGQVLQEMGLGRTKRGIPQARELNRIYPVEEESVR